jgi:hypothetical protein
MDFEKLKSAWDNEPQKEVVIPTDLQNLKKSELPVEMIKKMMVKELKYQSLGLLILAFPSYGFTNSKVYLLGYSYCVIISVLFLYKFYKFYKYLETYEANTKDNLYKIYYEIKLNLEAYKTWSYSIGPIIVLMFYVLFTNESYKNQFKFLNNQSDNLLLYAVIIFASGAYMYWATNWWIDKFYGKHLDRIKSLLFDLNEAETDYKESVILDNKNGNVLFDVKNISKKGWTIISIIVLILFGIGYYYGRWLALNGY